MRHALCMPFGIPLKWDHGNRRENMNNNSFTRPAARARGITLVEILLAISLLIILVGFALPSVGKATARSELEAAAENLQYSIGTARNVARMTESSVRLSIETSPGGATQTLTFSHPEKRGRQVGPAIQEYRLPEGVRLVSDRDSFAFDARGLVMQPGKIQLVSLTDEGITSTLVVD